MLLLVDDTLGILALYGRALGNAGFIVVTAGSGAEAIARLELERDRFDIVVTDIELGAGPDGWAVGRHARAIAPDIAVVYMSGDSGGAWRGRGVAASVMITKPIRPAGLIETVVALLAEAGGCRNAG
jgi:hypothetical protein